MKKKSAEPKTTKNFRSIWKGMLSFGLVNVPIAVYASTRDYKFAGHMFRASDQSRVKMIKVAEADLEVKKPLKELEASEIVKGYEQEDTSIVILNEQEMASINIPSTKAIEIEAFVSPEEIYSDTRLLSKTYFLQSNKKESVMADKGYAIVYQALIESKKVGIAKICIRNREYLAAVKADPKYKLISIDILHFADEMAETDHLRAVDTSLVMPQESKFALMLVESMSTGSFDHKRYKNEYTAALGELIASKKAGKAIKTPATKTAKDVPDILDALRESMAKHSSKKKAA